MVRYNQFTAAGSCLDPQRIIKGTVEGITFTSPEFTGTMDGQKFWDEFTAYAKKLGAYVVLVSG